jgi:hypothetical protein
MEGDWNIYICTLVLDIIVRAFFQFEVLLALLLCIVYI